MRFVSTVIFQTPNINSKSEHFVKFISRENFADPISAKSPVQDLNVLLENRSHLEARILRGRRILLRFSVQALSKTKGTRTYKHMRQRMVTLSVGSVAEAELAIDAVLQFAMSLNGKHLITEPVTEPQAIRNESAGQTPEP